jgi:hypothetical protein
MRLLVAIAFLLAGCVASQSLEETKPEAPKADPVPEHSASESPAPATQAAPQPQQARHESFVLNGTVFVTSDPVTGWNVLHCGECSMEVQFQEGAKSMVIEARMANGTDLPGWPSFFYAFRDYRNCGWLLGLWCQVVPARTHGEEGGNPLRHVRGDVLGPGTHLFEVWPQSLVPEVSKPFEAVVTVWYDAEPPSDWSYWS